MPANNTLERTVTYRWCIVFAMDCALANAEWHRVRPLNYVR